MKTYTVLYSERHAKEQLFFGNILSVIFNNASYKELPLYRDIDTGKVHKGSMALVNEDNSEKELEHKIKKYKIYYKDAEVVSKKAEREIYINAPQHLTLAF